MEQLRGYSKGYYFSAVASMILGAALLVWPETSMQTFCYTLGAVSVIFGLVKIIMYFTRDRKYVIADTGSMLYDEDELPIGGNVLFDLEGNVKRSNDYESISYGGDNGWLCVHNKKTNQTVYLNSDLKTELDLGDAYGAAGDFKKCLRRQ